MNDNPRPQFSEEPLFPPGSAPALPSTNRVGQAARPRRPGRRWTVSLGMVVVWAILLGLIIVNRQNLSDWWRMRNYHPSTAVSQLATEDTMTPYAQHLFYLNKPELLSNIASFRQHCPENKDTVVLGCYHPGENGIYIYNVQDPSLTGVAQVTAAHETLHAVYARLSPTERTNVNNMLNDYYKNGLKDSQVISEIKLYRQTEPGAVLDEMHSTFGTEIANLPSPLETYYKKYFSNRAAIIAYSNRYETEFTARQKAISQDDQQLASMKKQIDAQEAALQSQQNAIAALKKQMDKELAASQTAAYNAAVPSYNSQVSAYNSGVTTLKQAIAQYNQFVDARNNVAKALTTLDKALDTRLNQQSTQK